MIIRRMSIKSFGKIRNRDLELSPGLNVLYGENESGKTTVHTFLRSMLYGITRQRGRAAKTDTYTTYEPWEDPASYGGILWFENGGREFRLTRSFHKNNPAAELYCIDDGEQLDVAQGDLDTVLGDISEAVYENTVSVAQLKSVTGQDLVRELQNYMASYQGTGDCSVDLGRAMQMLKMTRKGYQVQKERREREIQAEQEKLQMQMGYLSMEMEELKKKEAGTREKEKELKRQGGGNIQEELLQTIREKKRKAARLSRVFPLTILLTILLTVVCAFFLPMRILAVIPALLGVGSAIWEYKQIEQNAAQTRRMKRLLAKYRQKQEKLDWDLEGLTQNYTEKETARENLRNEFREYEAQAAMDTVQETEIQALNLAMFTISTLSEQFQMQVGGRLRDRTSRILSEITGGKYQEVLLDRDFHMTVNTQDRILPLESLSRGTLEQIYFALRMAAGELLCGEEQFPVILDDVFGMYDEERLAAVLHWLEKQGRQVIISTCNKREMEILEREGISLRLIRLY
ncbi:MAG: AAA family ATPase [Blautia sp.]|nr:AAA family ATPase [Blautia sp.]